MYVRGNALDYDKWEELGNTGWSYSDVLPYFKKSESARFNNSNNTIDYDYHGFDGLQGIDIPKEIPEMVFSCVKLQKTGFYLYKTFCRLKQL